MPIGITRHLDWNKPAKQRSKRVWNLTLEDPAFDPVFAYADATNPDGHVTDTLRELILMGLAADAKDPSIRFARITAAKEAREQVRIVLFGAIHEFMRRMGLGGVGPSSEDTGPVPVNKITSPEENRIFHE